MKAFIQRLMMNPALANEPKIVVEDNILAFFTQNQRALKATFSSPQFFPNLNWQQVQQLFLLTLMEEINVYLLPDIKVLVEKKIDFAFLNAMLHRQIPANILQGEIFKFCGNALKQFEVRRHLEGLFNVINNNLIDKYITESFEKKSYIAREITIVERLKLQPDMLPGLIKIIMLVSLIGFVRSDNSNADLNEKMQSKRTSLGSYHTQKAYYERMIKQFTTSMSIFTEDIINRCIGFHLNFEDDKSIHATSRLAKILMFMGKNYKPGQKRDKGADTYEKSWFQGMRKNYKYFGFDIDMLNELYRISAENYW